MLGNFRSFLRLRGIETLTPMFFNDEELLAGYAGEFVVPLDRAGWTFSCFILAWLEGRAERSLSLRFGEPEAQVRSIPETEAFVWAAQRCLAAPGNVRDRLAEWALKRTARSESGPCGVD
jgi:hypothetical protein